MSVIILEKKELGTLIKVVGVGGAGGNAVAHMIQSGLQGVEFICVNTDAQVLSRTGASKILQLGATGLGAGANPDVGRELAMSERSEIAEMLRDAHMVFVTAGMGGGTGTGAAPVVASVAREMGILTVGVVSKPFEFEGAKRSKVAREGIAELSRSVDSLIVVLNERLEEVLGDEITQRQAFQAADDILHNAVSGIAEIINAPGMINVDFQDVVTVMSERGRALMGSGIASGPNRAREAAQVAIACPLLEGINLLGAKGLLVNITASEETLLLKEPKEVMQIVRDYASEEATIIYGAVYDESMGDKLRVTVVATGLCDQDTLLEASHNVVSKEGVFVGEEPHQGIPAAVTRRDPVVAHKPGVRSPAQSHVSDRLDIPSFLKKQKIES